MVRTDIPDGERWIDVEALPCAVNALHEVTCWNQDSEMVWEDLREVEVKKLMLNSRPYLVGITPDDHHRVLACQPQDILFPYWRFCPDVDEPVVLASTWGGFTDAGILVGSSEYASNPPPARDWLVVDHDWYFVGIDTEHVVHMREETLGTSERVEVLDLPFDLRGEPQGIAGRFADELFMVCVHDTSGEVQCEGTAYWADYLHFDNPPYRQMASQGVYVCAQRVSDHVVECSDGSERDFGEPLQHLAISTQGGITPGYLSQPDYVVPVCGISYDNRILCDHPTYFSDETLQALEELP